MKYLKLISLSLLGFCFFQITASAGTEIVKTLSSLCANPDFQFKGSGLIFRNGTRVFVLTSDHVLLHGRSPRACHWVQTDSGEKIKAELIAVDWGVGLGLLEISNPGKSLTQNSRTFADLKETFAEEGEMEVVTQGFPAELTTSVLDSSGKILLWKSPRHEIALVKQMIELVHAHGEFGMSGSPVFSKKTGDFIGMLSHQYLEEIAGAHPQVMNWSANTQGFKSHLLVIPSDEILNWLNTFFLDEENFSPAFLCDLDAQIWGRSVVESGGLRFELTSSIANEKPIGGGDAAGIGGGNGGGDGAGIGGDGSPISKLQKNRIQVSESRVNQPWKTHWPFSTKLDWKKGLAQKLGQGKTIVIESIYVKKTFWERQAVQSLAGYFQCLEMSQIRTPALVFPAEFQPGKHGFVQELAEFQKLSRSKNDFEATAFLDHLTNLVQLANSEDWSAVTQSDFDLVLSDENGWKALFNFPDHFEEAIQIYSNTQELSRTLAKGRL